MIDSNVVESDMGMMQYINCLEGKVHFFVRKFCEKCVHKTKETRQVDPFPKKRRDACELRYKTIEASNKLQIYIREALTDIDDVIDAGNLLRPNLVRRPAEQAAIIQFGERLVPDRAGQSLLWVMLPRYFQFGRGIVEGPAEAFSLRFSVHAARYQRFLVDCRPEDVCLLWAFITHGRICGRKKIPRLISTIESITSSSPSFITLIYPIRKKWNNSALYGSLQSHRPNER